MGCFFHGLWTMGYGLKDVTGCSYYGLSTMDHGLFHRTNHELIVKTTIYFYS